MAGTIIADRIQADAGSNAVTILSNTGTTVATFGGDGQLRFIAGSASVPAIAPSGDLNTGIFFPAADTIAFTEGGTEAMRIDSSGNLGINTTSPAARLHVVDSGGQNGTIKLGGNDASLGLVVTYNQASSTTTTITSNPTYTNTSAAMILRVDGDASATANQLYLKGNGFIGMGRDPAFPLDLQCEADYGRAISNIGGTPFFIWARSRGSKASPTSVASGDTWGHIFTAYDGTDYVGGARIFAAVDGTPGTNDMPLRLDFYTSSDGSTTPVERARITSGGYFKASNDGTYTGATGIYHEFKQSAQDYTLVTWGTNASLTSSIQEVYASRSATSAYTFINVYSNLGGTSDREFQLRGDGNAYADGTWNNNGADYAEFFESATGAALTLGATVVLDGNKVREATDQDPASAIMGVVRPKEPSKASMVVGNTAWNKWANKYLTDDFDRFIMEDHNVLEWTDGEGKLQTYESHSVPADVVVPDDAVVKTHDDKGNKFQHYKLNPAWNPDAEYVNRENRPEWIIVGLVGQVKVLKGQPVNDRWIKMRDVSETVEEWMIR